MQMHAHEMSHARYTTVTVKMLTFCVGACSGFWGLAAGDALGVSSSHAISASAAACARCANFWRCSCFCCSLCSLQGSGRRRSETI